MSSLDRPVRRAIYLAVLNAAEPSPLLPETRRRDPSSAAEPRHRKPSNSGDSGGRTGIERRSHRSRTGSDSE